MRLAKASLMFVAMVFVVFWSVGCTADEGFQKGLLDGVAGAISTLITVPVEAWINTAFPAA